MKVPNSRSAARWFDRVRSPDGYFEPTEPAEPGTIHAYLFDPDSPRGPQQWILKQTGTALLEGGAEEAACGMGVRTIYRLPFDTTDPDTCPHCAEMAVLWQRDPAEFQRRVDERHQRWAERELRNYEADDEADLARQESNGNDPIKDDEQRQP